MQLVFSVEHPSYRFNQQVAYQEKVLKLLRGEGIQKELFLSVVFMTDEDLLAINKTYLNHDYYTDIITFPIEEDENALEAEIYISVDRVKNNALELEEDFKNELLRVFLHGVLHLVGYGDKTADEIELMRAKESFYMNA